MSIIFQIPGNPRGKERARWSPVSRSWYTPKKTQGYEKEIAQRAKIAMAGKKILSGPVRLAMDAFFSIPESWTKAKKLAAATNQLRPGKPDADNILKVASDAMNKIVWNDDAQVAEATIRKYYADQPCLRITVEKINPTDSEVNHAKGPILD